MYDFIIIGGGPAGAAAGVYAGRKKLKTLLLTESFGGQSIVSTSIENWVGEISISGIDLAQKLEKHVKSQKEVEIKMEKAVKLNKLSDNKLGFEVATSKNKYQVRAILIASGGRHRKLGVPGEKELDGRGVAYCSTCDAPLFRNKTVAVVGGGNSGLEAVVDLFPYAKKIFLLEYGDSLKGDPVTQEEVKNSDKTEIILKAQTQEILGDKLVTGLRYKDLIKNEDKELKVDGVFVEIGVVPNSEFVGDLVKKNKYGEIEIDFNTGATSQKGIFAAGDVTNKKYKQNNIATGDAVSATLAAYDYLRVL